MNIGMNGWMDGWCMDGQTDGWMDGQSDRWMTSGSVSTHTVHYYQLYN